MNIKHIVIHTKKKVLITMINLDYTNRTPIYEQIVTEIEKYVALGILKEKEQIMSIRELASSLGINPNTVKKAYSILEAKGIITSISTKGTFIKENASKVKEETINNYLNDIKNIMDKLYKLGVSKENIIDKLKTI